MQNDNRKPSEGTGLPVQLGGVCADTEKAEMVGGGFSALQPRATQRESELSFERQRECDEDAVTSLTTAPHPGSPASLSLEVPGAGCR